MPQTHEMHVKKAYFALLKTGQKKVEFRLNDEKRQRIVRGDFIRFFCSGDKEEAFELEVDAIIHGHAFGELIKGISEELMGGMSSDEMQDELQCFYDKDEEMRYGVVALILRSKYVH